MTNKEVKDYAKNKGVYMWQIADGLNISIETLTRRFRHELLENDKQKIIELINKLEERKK